MNLNQLDLWAFLLALSTWARGVSGLEMRGAWPSASPSMLSSQILLPWLFKCLKSTNCLYYRYASQRKILPESSLNISKTMIKCSFPLSLEIWSFLYGVTVWTKLIEQVSCCCTETSTRLHILTYCKKCKQFVIGDLFHLKEYIEISLYLPLEKCFHGGICPLPQPTHHCWNSAGAWSGTLMTWGAWSIKYLTFAHFKVWSIHLLYCSDSVWGTTNLQQTLCLRFLAVMSSHQRLIHVCFSCIIFTNTHFHFSSVLLQLFFILLLETSLIWQHTTHFLTEQNDHIKMNIQIVL